MGTDLSLLPAHAGVIPDSTIILRHLQSAPRACGGDPSGDHLLEETTNCSPRMRG